MSEFPPRPDTSPWLGVIVLDGLPIVSAITLDGWSFVATMEECVAWTWLLRDVSREGPLKFPE